MISWRMGVLTGSVNDTEIERRNPGNNITVQYALKRFSNQVRPTVEPSEIMAFQRDAVLSSLYAVFLHQKK